MPKVKLPMRRRKSAASRRETILKVLITEEELALMKEAAQRCGLGTSTWMRLMALDALQSERLGGQQ
jgi:hypothetical protein